MTKLMAFLKRDLAIETNYRVAFTLQTTWVVLSAASYYFLARFVGGSARPGLEVYGGDYFAFVLIGVALNDYLATAVEAFSRSIRDSQLTGTLEALLSTQTSLPTIVLSSAAYPFLSTSCAVVLYLAAGVGLFGLRLGHGNWLAAALLLGLGIVAFSGLGILSASFILVFKRGSSLGWLLASLSWVVGGVMYPVSVLPEWLRHVSAWLPITYAIEGMRAALLQNASWPEIWRSAVPLALFALVLLPASLAVFQYATRLTRVTGTMAQY